MIILNKFDEFGKGMGFPSMRDFFEKSKYKNQDHIIEYLKNGKATMTRTSFVKDVFTGEPLGMEKIFMNDGVYSWSNDLAYYVEKYNLRLPDDFVNHVLNKLSTKSID